MQLKDIIECLEEFAPVTLQEGYDNAGLIIGSADVECSGIITALDVTENVINEAIEKKCNLIVAHHPIIFKGLKKLNGKNYVERCVITAIKNDIAIYAIHTNIDNVLNGVNQKIAQKLNLQNTKVLLPKEGILKKLVTFCPQNVAEQIKNILFNAGAGVVGKYSECSFSLEGVGTFKAGEAAEPYVGKIGERHSENETRIEVIFPDYIQYQVIESLIQTHPYEEVAYDIYTLNNVHENIGSGLIGDLPESMPEENFLAMLKKAFNLTIIRHTPLLHKKITKVAVCGGAGSFLISAAKASGAGAYVTSDVKYHEFFDADNAILLADIGHYESEQFTTDLLTDILQQKFPNFAVQKTGIMTNPVSYYL
jgi:dinuclear metal center YbgI/SA1388 family protein